MYSPAEDPKVEDYLEKQADKLGSYDAAWAATEAKFDVARPTYGDAATFVAEANQKVSPKDAQAIGEYICGDCLQIAPCAHVAVDVSGARRLIG